MKFFVIAIGCSRYTYARLQTLWRNSYGLQSRRARESRSLENFYISNTNPAFWCSSWLRKWAPATLKNLASKKLLVYGVWRIVIYSHNFTKRILNGVLYHRTVPVCNTSVSKRCHSYLSGLRGNLKNSFYFASANVDALIILLCLDCFFIHNLLLQISIPAEIIKIGWQPDRGRLKTRNWKTRDHQKCRGGKRGTGKRGTILQGVENARPTVMERRTYIRRAKKTRHLLHNEDRS